VLDVDGGICWIHTDHQGSTAAVTDGAGVVHGAYAYSPYGETHTTGGSLGANLSWFGYTGREFDAETGNYQYRARYYHPTLGRFLSTDPIGTKDDPNLYFYVGGDPVNATDPTGMQSYLPPGSGATPEQSNAIVDWALEHPEVTGNFISALGVLAGQPEVVVAGRMVATGGAANRIVEGSTAVPITPPASTLRPGPYADRSIPARNSDRNFTTAEREATNENMAQSGCHACGSRDAGTKSGNAVPDHQPPSAINPPGGSQELYPQCLNCSTRQMREVRQEQLRRRREGQ
jgi:RHS repeat-associated protein